MNFLHHPAEMEHARLVAGVRAGDEAVFEELFCRYYPTLFRFAYGFVGDRDMADDIVQDVLGAVWLRHAEWAPAGNIESYLVAAVRNRALNQVRNTRSQTEARARHADAGESPGMAAPAEDAEQFEREEAIDVVWRAIARLPEPRRTVLLLRWQHGYDWNTIAHILGVTAVAVRKQHSRAMDALRHLLPRETE